MDLDKVLNECLEGKEGAWKMLVNAYSKRVFNLAYQFAGSYQEAEDLTQDIFLKLFHSLPKYDFEKNFSAWLLTLARNHLIDTYRKTKWEKANRDDFNEHFLALETAESPEASLVKKARQKMLWESLNHLASEMRIALILRDIQDKSYEEIAEILSLPIGTVKSRINRGRLQLAKILQEKKESSDEL